MLGWNVTIVTTDGHAIWHNSTKSIMEAPIKIGNHVWLGAYVKVGKGVCLPDDCVVAQSSLVTKQFNASYIDRWSSCKRNIERYHMEYRLNSR